MSASSGSRPRGAGGGSAGGGQCTGAGAYVIAVLASKQSYALWLTTMDGKVHKRFGVPVHDCRATSLDVRV